MSNQRKGREWDTESQQDKDVMDALYTLLAIIMMVVVFYFGIKWALNEPIYCGNSTCSESVEVYK